MAEWFLLPDFLSSASVRLSFRCSMVSNAVFWIASGLCLWADHLVATQSETQWKSKSKIRKHISKTLKSCKIQPNRIILGRDRSDLITLAFFNMVFVACFICCPLYGYLWNKIQAQTNAQTYPLIAEKDWNLIWKDELLVKLPIHALVAEVSFYILHGLLHWSPFLYRHVHKVHHRFPAPTAMTCVYAHPVEFALGNVLPIYLGPIFCNAHPTTCYLWWALAMLGTCKGHCGYRIMGHEDDHEDHHLLYKYNYGGMGLLDRMLGTTPPKRKPTQTLSKTIPQTLHTSNSSPRKAY